MPWIPDVVDSGYVLQGDIKERAELGCKGAAKVLYPEDEQMHRCSKLVLMGLSKKKWRLQSATSTETMQLHTGVEGKTLTCCIIHSLLLNPSGFGQSYCVRCITNTMQMFKPCWECIKESRLYVSMPDSLLKIIQKNLYHSTITDVAVSLWSHVRQN